MTYLNGPSNHFDRCIILLQYIKRETAFAVRYDGPLLHTYAHTHTNTFCDSKSGYNILWTLFYVNLRPYLTGKTNINCPR